MRLEDALWANVIEEHWGLGLDTRLGRLAEGYLADLVILDRDPFRGGQGGGSPRILATACDGILRYEVPGWERD
jgi:predicted amidohydrolase YtcJ